MSVLLILQEALSWALILSGAFFVLTGAIGVVRLPDFWTRLHATSVTDSAGVILLFLGLILQAGFSLIAVKLAIIGVFLFITGPTTTHATANAALVSGLRPKVAQGLTGAEPETKHSPRPDPSPASEA